ncbi:hypothetical protein [Bradyrhizobium sp.]|uniref:hypothetical protein n=1 Tax=Bradyrhizobium sp. TaxID=376 RepID=UPI002E0C5289|nr:hypothetical protein [Bradyrhizobium sp.]
MWPPAWRGNIPSRRWLSGGSSSAGNGSFANSDIPCLERDQHASVEAAKHAEAVDALQLIHGFAEQRMQQHRRDRVEHVANMVVTRDFGDAKQTGAVGAAMAFFELPLMRQERRALHEEHGKGRHSDVAHAVGRVDAAALVREPVQAAAQRPKQGTERTHACQESHSGVLANPFSA